MRGCGIGGLCIFFFFKEEDGIRDKLVTGVQTCALPILVTNPEISAVTDALKAVKIAEQLGTHTTGFVLNRVSGKSHEMTQKDILNMLDNVPYLGQVSEDVAVMRAVSSRVPVVRHSPSARASGEIMNIAASLVGEETRIRAVTPWYRKMFPFIK